ncbi:hypothetical protein HOC96_03560 [archaeon]|nr:hypothetical protein [archaeon]
MKKMNDDNKLIMAKTEEQQEFWDRLRPVNRVATSDTYKRTMSGSSDLFANSFACYNLAARRPLKEDGVNGRFIMAGIEKMLYPWFTKPITEREVDRAREFFQKKGAVKKFPEAAWQKALDNDGFMPVDIYSLPGGQTFLAKDGKHVPMMSVEGVGAIVSHLEPHLTTIYAPLIQATKARLFKEIVGDKFAEFGLRGDRNSLEHVALMGALYVGGGINLTSDDQAVYLFSEYFKDVGTMGHEFVMAHQRSDISLEEAQKIAYKSFVEANARSALLPDTIDTMQSGLPAILALMKEYRDAGSDKIIMPRFDSGDVTAQGIHWVNKMVGPAGLHKMHVIEDGRTPQKARQTQSDYSAVGIDPTVPIEGAGGYFQNGVSRDAPSVAYKRSATMHTVNGKDRLEASLKFSDSEGKRSIPGQIRIYARDNTIIVAQAGEEIDGEALMQKVVSNGRISYNEDWHVQADRADKTWNKYSNIEYSPLTQAMIDVRVNERNAILERLVGEGLQYQS